MELEINKPRRAKDLAMESTRYRAEYRKDSELSTRRSPYTHKTKERT
jgi:hypothetical protein